MKTKVPKGLYLVPLLYLGIITIFVYLQFSGVDTFTSTVSHLTAMGRISKSPLGGDDNISDLQIFGTGILFPLDNQNPVRIYSSDGLVHKAEPFRYSTSGGRLIIDMTSGMTLTLTPEEENPESVVLGMEFPEYSSIKSVSIPFTLMMDYYLETTGSLPVFSINDRINPEVTMLTLPMGASLEEEEKRIIIPCGENGIDGILVERTTDTQDPLSFWFSKKADLLTEEEYNTFLEEYLSSSMEGWRNTRYESDKGRWTMPEGEPVFSEKIAAILMSESMSANEYRDQFDKITIARANTSRNLSLLTVPFLGDIIKVTQDELRKEKTRIQTAERMIEDNDTAIFKIHDLYSLMHIHNPDTDTDNLISLAWNSDRSTMSPEILSGLLKYYLDRLENGGDTEEINPLIDELATAWILPKIQVLQEGFFLESNPYESDLLLSIRTGVYFIKCGMILDREILSVLGRELIYSSLSMTDILGIIPAVLHFEDGLILTKGSVPPEDIYPLIFTNPYYPREQKGSLLEDQGTWIYSSATEIKSYREENSVKYTFKYRLGEIHYILIQGIKPFKRMKMLGLNWKPDPIFYRYYSGWFYDRNSESLYIKMKNKSEVEEIILYY